MNVYKGIRTGDGCKVTVNETELPLRLDLWNHSSSGFEWGYEGSGPAQLALAILVHYTGDPELAKLHHQRFKQEIIAHLDEDSWTLWSTQIQEWLESVEKREGGLVAYYKIEAGEPKL